MDGEEAVAISVTMMEGRRIDRWAGDVHAKVAGFRQQLPSTVGLEVVFDQSSYVETRLSGLFGNFLLGTLFVGTGDLGRDGLALGAARRLRTTAGQPDGAGDDALLGDSSPPDVRHGV